MAVFWVVAPCSVVEVYGRFRGACCLHHQDDDSHSGIPVRNVQQFFKQPFSYFAKETCHATSERLNPTIRGLSTIEIIYCRGSVRMEEGSINQHWKCVSEDKILHNTFFSAILYVKEEIAAISQFKHDSITYVINRFSRKIISPRRVFVDILPLKLYISVESDVSYIIIWLHLWQLRLSSC
jgi:hypothetical protein